MKTKCTAAANIGIGQIVFVDISISEKPVKRSLRLKTKCYLCSKVHTSVGTLLCSVLIVWHTSLDVGSVVPDRK